MRTITTGKTRGIMKLASVLFRASVATGCMDGGGAGGGGSATSSGNPIHCVDHAAVLDSQDRMTVASEVRQIDLSGAVVASAADQCQTDNVTRVQASCGEDGNIS